MQGVITALKPDTRRRGKVVVHLDGRPAFTLAQAIALSLTVGDRLDDSTVADLKRQERLELGYQMAMRLIALRPRSAKEIQTRLKRRGFEPGDRELITDQLLEGGHLNDAGFANAWIENRMAFRPRGARALQAELRQKGLDSETISAALQGFDEQAAAEAAALKGARSYASLEEPLFRRRLTAYLSRRGFSYPTISPLVKRMWRETAVEANESEVEQ